MVIAKAIFQKKTRDKEALLPRRRRAALFFLGKTAITMQASGNQTYDERFIRGDGKIEIIAP